MDKGEQRVIQWIVGALAVIVLIAIVVAVGPFAVVANGQEGVLTTFSAANGTEFRPGLHLKWPLVQSVVRYPTYPQRIDERGTTAATADLQTVSMEVVLNYALDPQHILQIHRSLGPDYAHIILDANVPALVKNATAQFTAQQLLHERTMVEQRALSLIQQRVGSLTRDLLTVAAVSFNDVEFGHDYTQAIERKVVAQQDLARAEIEAQQRVAQASGQAQATLTLARAQAAAQRLQVRTLTPLYVQYQALARWNGQLPTYNGGSAIPFLQIPGASSSSGGHTP